MKAFFTRKFPNLDLSDITIYQTSSTTMNRAGFKEAGGLFVAHMKIILLRRNIEIEADRRGAFNRELDKAIKTKVATEDVLVHEMLHAVSAKARSGRQFSFGEEEFVYTNAVEFYKAEGKSEEDIINQTLIPFCITDVLSDRKEMTEIFAKLRSSGLPIPDMFKVPKESYRNIMDTHAKKVVPMIVGRAREIGHEMIRLHNQYGSQQLHSNDAPTNTTTIRFHSIDMDDDW